MHSSIAFIMQRARHRFRRAVPEKEGVSSVPISLVKMDRKNNYIRFKRDLNSVRQLLITTLALSCLSTLSSVHPVSSAELGIRLGQVNVSESASHRPILHRGSDDSSNFSGRSGDSRKSVGSIRNSTGESALTSKSHKNTPEEVVGGEDKHSTRASLHFACKNCGNASRGQASSLHLGPESGEDTHRIESILREIFLDELDDNAFQDKDEDQDDEVEYTRHQHISGEHFGENDEVKLSRHGRSPREEDEATPLFPEGRAFQGGKAKGTRSAPGGAGITENDADNPRAGSSNGKRGKSSKKAKKSSATKASTDLNKYNEYMDAVFNRMNTMIKKKRMDPLRVNLFAGPSKAKGQQNKNKNKNKGKNGGGNKSQKHSPRMDLDSEEVDGDDDDDEIDSEKGPARKDIYLQQVVHENDQEVHGLDEEESEEQDAINHDEATVRKIRAILENAGNSSSSSLQESPTSDSDSDSRGNESKPKKPSSSTKGNRNKPKDKGQNKGNNNNNNNTTKNKKNKNSQSQESQKNKNKNKNKKQAQSQRSKPTRGILHGLSSLKRDGNVAVIRQGDKVRVVRANFLLGPVSLEILPKKSRANDDKPVAATATAPKLKGILEVRLKKGAPTSIRKLRVYPPKGVKVDGAAAGGSVGTAASKRKPQQYGKVTPMATARLRQIASTVVRQTDNKRILPITS